MNKTRYKKPRNRFLIPADFLALYNIYLNIYKPVGGINLAHT